jgi:peptidoglycan hydrolase CwlO-like protein
MDLSALSQLLPLGGATLLLMYLIGVIIQERRQSTVERNSEREQWQRDRAILITEHQTAMAIRDADRDRTIEYLRTRVVDLNKEAGEMRAQIAAAQAAHHNCEMRVDMLEREINTLSREIRNLGGTP